MFHYDTKLASSFVEVHHYSACSEHFFLLQLYCRQSFFGLWVLLKLIFLNVVQQFIALFMKYIKVLKFLFPAQ